LGKSQRAIARDFSKIFVRFFAVNNPSHAFAIYMFFDCCIA
jgi:hypothetical protein